MKKSAQFDHHQKVSPASKPTKLSKIWQQILKARGLALMTKRFASPPPPYRQVRFYLKADFHTSKAARLCSATAGTAAGGEQALRSFCRRLTFDQTCIQHAAPRGKLGTRQTGLRSFFKVSRLQTTTQTNSLVIVSSAPSPPKINLTLPLFFSPWHSTHPCFHHPLPNDCASRPPGELAEAVSCSGC